MDLKLKDRRALLTGSSAGIGYAIARGLAAEGAQVTLTGRSQASVDRCREGVKMGVPQGRRSRNADCGMRIENVRKSL